MHSPPCDKVLEDFEGFVAAILVITDHWLLITIQTACRLNLLVVG